MDASSRQLSALLTYTGIFFYIRSPVTFGIVSIVV
jgi:hypothetical protein